MVRFETRRSNALKVLPPVCEPRIGGSVKAFQGSRKRRRAARQAGCQVVLGLAADITPKGSLVGAPVSDRLSRLM
jgi:hypothetical protein